MPVVEHELDPGRWVEAHGDVLWRYAVVRVRSAETAEDLIQETLVAALEAAPAFRAECTERTWLVSILRRKIADHERREIRRRERLGPADAGAMATMFDERGRWRFDPGRGPEDSALESGEFWRDFERCLAKMPAGLAEAFVMREQRASTSEVICSTLGISLENLWVRLHRARVLLRMCMSRRWAPVRKTRC